jgi:hypothetical protein
MSREPAAEDFLRRFALPLVAGGELHVGRPLLGRGANELLAAVSSGIDGTPVGEELAQARRRALAALVPLATTPLLSEDRSSVLLLVGLHDLLFLLHPDAERLSAARRAAILSCVLKLCEKARQQLPFDATVLRPGRGPLRCAAPPPLLRQAGLRLLGRHTLLGRLTELLRTDVLVTTARGEQRHLGMEPRRSFFGGPAEPPERVRVPLFPELQRLRDRGEAGLQALHRASPLSPLLGLGHDGLSQVLSEHAAWLRLPLVARLVTASLSALGTATALRVLGAELAALLPGRERSTEDVMTALCLHSHCQALAAIERVPPPVEAPDACALYAALYPRWPQLAAPRDALRSPALRRRLDEHVAACRELAGPERVQQALLLLTAALAPLAAPPQGTLTPHPPAEP